MASPERRVPENVPGDFYVDSTCIDCDVCRQLAPDVFGDAPETARVWAQPATRERRRAALQALVCCPVGAIGCQGEHDTRPAMADFPQVIEEPVYYCGFSSPNSYGGHSYLIRRPDGNWLVDSPRFTGPVVRHVHTLGGLSRVFLTHRDDVADAERYAWRFEAQRVIHRGDLDAQPDAEWIIEGEASIELAPGVVAIPTAGHTAGHCCLLIDDRYLFSGDHLAWDEGKRCLTAFRNYCWHSWERQLRSLERLRSFRFEWVLPGHGRRIHLPAAEMAAQLDALLSREH